MRGSYSGLYRKCFVFALPILLILGLKAPNIGVDTVSYINRYEYATEMMDNAATGSEMGFNIYNLFLSQIGCGWQLYLFITSLLIVIGYVVFLNKYSNDFGISWFVFITIGLFTMNMSGLRQSFAIAICLCALCVLSKLDGKRIYRYLLFYALIMLAVSIHNSAIIFSIVPFMYNRRLTRNNIWILLIIAVAALFYKNVVTGLLPSFEGTRYDEMSFDQNYAINPLKVLFTISVPFLCLWVIPTEEDGRFSSKISLMFMFACITVFFEMLSINNNQLGRMGYYFQSYCMILVPAALMSVNTESRSLVKLVAYVVCITYFVMGTIGGTLGIDNYRFFWQ